MSKADTLLVYEKPTCTTCRKLVKLLNEKGIDFDRLNYFIDPIPRDTLVDLLKKMSMSPRELLRTRDQAYKDLGMKNPDLTDKEIIDAMVAHPGLIQRPIIQRGSKVVLGRPVENVLELL